MMDQPWTPSPSYETVEWSFYEGEVWYSDITVFDEELEPDDRRYLGEYEVTDGDVVGCS